MRIVAADVGGTKSLVALYEGEAGALVNVRERRYSSPAHPGIAPILADFLGEMRDVDAAAIGVAGPVIGDTCRTSNLPWHIDARDIERDLSLGHVHLLNDFEAVAFGIDELDEEGLYVLQDREADASAPAAVLGAGTGLGEAILLPQPGSDLPRVLGTEGGHTDFGPRDATEIALLTMLLERFERVSYERILSGAGVELLYEFVVSRGLEKESAEIAKRLAETDDRAAVIGQSAVRGDDAACVRAIEIFVSILGAEAGNLALKTLPRGGLYVAGGIAPKILDCVVNGPFMRSFRAKGRMEAVLDRIRVCVVLEQKVGLLGARRVAVSIARGR